MLISTESYHPNCLVAARTHTHSKLYSPIYCGWYNSVGLVVTVVKATLVGH